MWVSGSWFVGRDPWEVHGLRCSCSVLELVLATRPAAAGDVNVHRTPLLSWRGDDDDDDAGDAGVDTKGRMKDEEADESAMITILERRYALVTEIPRLLLWAAQNTLPRTQSTCWFLATGNARATRSSVMQLS